jgi:hypothetical protein
MAPPATAAAAAAAAAAPTLPLSASTILQTLLSHYRGHGCSSFPKDASAAQRRVRTGYAEIDEYVLQGGVERGVVLGVSADIIEERLGRVVSERISFDYVDFLPGWLGVSVVGTVVKMCKRILGIQLEKW